MMHDYRRQDSGMAGVGTFLAGVMFGAAAGLLLAPHSGRENREALKQRAQQVRNKMREGREQAIDATKAAAGSVQEMIDRGEDAVGNAAEDMEAGNQ